MACKPEGYTDLAPCLPVPDAEAVPAFCTTVLDAERSRVIPAKNGAGILHAECRIRDTLLMMGETAEGPGARRQACVDDPGACLERALRAGASEFQPLTKKGDGDRRCGGLRSPCGTSWFIARQMP